MKIKKKYVKYNSVKTEKYVIYGDDSIDESIVPTAWFRCGKVCFGKLATFRQTYSPLVKE